MSRRALAAAFALITTVTGCDDSDTAPAVQQASVPAAQPTAAQLDATAPPTVTAPQSPISPQGAALPGPPANQPAANATVNVQPGAPGASTQPPGGQAQGQFTPPPLPAGFPVGAGNVEPPAAGPAAVFVPFPPFVISAPASMAGGEAIANGSPPGFPPGFAPPGAVAPAGAAQGERKPQTALEAYRGVRLFAVAPDGVLLATYATDEDSSPAAHELKLWDLTTGKLRATLESQEILRELVISPDGTLLATVAGGEDAGELTLWELPAGTKTSTHNWSKYGSVSFASDSQRIVTNSGKQGLAILDLPSGKVKAKHVKNMAKLLVVKALPNQPLLALGLGVEKRSDDKKAPAGATAKELAELRKQKQQQQQQQQQQAQAAAKKKRKGKGKEPEVSPYDQFGLDTEAEGVIQIIDLDTLKVRKKLYVTGAPAELAVSAQGTMLAALMVGGQGQIWNTATWDEQGGKFSRTNTAAPPPTVQPDGKQEKSTVPDSVLLVVAPNASFIAARHIDSETSPADLWDTQTGQPRAVDPAVVSQLGFLPSGELIVAGPDKGLQFFSLPAGKAAYPPFAKP